MSRRTTRRVLAWVAGVPLGAVVGMVLLSGSGQPVTAHAYPHWQPIAPPPLSPRTDPLGVHVGHWVLLLGGRHGASRPRDGAAYDLRTGIWRHLPTPVALSGRDVSVAVGRALVVGSGQGAGSSWWYLDPGRQAWSRMTGVPAPLRAPSAFAGALYALSGRRVEVYSTQLDRWTTLPPDRLTPPLHGTRVTASRTGTTVSGRAAGRLVADRWDGLRWTRSAATPAPAPSGHSGGEVRLDVGGRVFLVRDDRAWIRLP